MKKISVVTLGCKVNQYDTAVILNNLPKSKYIKNDKFDDKADIYVIDTCTVTHKADSEARNYIYRAKRSNPDGVVVVTGCYAQVSSGELSNLSEVDYIVGNSHKFNSLINIIREGEVQKNPVIHISDIFKEKKRKFETPDIHHFPERTRAYLKVQDGCNYACTFCIIPKARGRSRSLDINDIISRLKILAESGYKEVVLTGIHLASYGKDIGTDLLSLLKEIDRSRSIKRIRLSSLDPADINYDLIEFASISYSICPSFHISLQSGDSDILKKMRRRYIPDHFLTCTNQIREIIPEASIGTDLMVGFPGETETEFQNTYEIAKESELTYFHVFPYSIRKNTAASKMENQVDSQTKKYRSNKLRKLGLSKTNDFYRSFIGKKINVLVENKNRGTSSNYINVKLPDFDYEIGDEVKLKVHDVIDGQVIAYPC